MTIQSSQLSVSHNANFINWTIRVKEYDLVLDRKTGELTAKISSGFDEKTGEEITETITIEQLVKDNNISFVLLPNGEELSLTNKREYFNRAADHYYLSHTRKSYEELKESGYIEFKKKSWADDCNENDWKTMEEAFACGMDKARMAIAEEQKTAGGKKDEKYTAAPGIEKAHAVIAEERKTVSGKRDKEYTVAEWDGAEWVGVATFESIKQAEEFVNRAKTELASIRPLGEMMVCTDFSGIYPHGASIFSNLEDWVKKNCK